MSALNAAMFIQQWKGFGLSPKAFAATVIFLSLCYATSGPGSLVSRWLLLVPEKILTHPTTLFTAPFVELRFIDFVLTLITVPVMLRYFEKLWGWQEVFKFSAFVLVVSNIIAVDLSLIQAFLLSPSFGSIAYRGSSALQVGFLVALTQLMPEHQIQIFRFKARVKSLPMAYVTFSNIACIFLSQSPYILIQFGWLTSWAYLRFIKWYPDSGSLEAQTNGNGQRGDRSETFAFANWFPPFLQPHVRKGTNLVFAKAQSFGFFADWQEEAPVGSSRADAERRRALALKALDQRVQSRPSQESVLQPLLEGDQKQ